LPDGGIVQVNASTNCCNGGPGNGLAVCKLDSSGIPRCFGGYSPQCPTGYTGAPGCCIAPGDTCQFSDQCCNGQRCLPADGGLRCGVASCRRLGDTCTTQADCCEGTFCIQGACRPFEEGDAGVVDGGTDAGTLCRANREACQFSVECCSQICTNGTCSPSVVCQPVGAVCTSSADCCSGNACVIPGGSTTGTCQPNSCVGPGQTCSVGGTPCCAGLGCYTPLLTPCGATGPCTCTVPIN
jgi:hypothetical protein